MESADFEQLRINETPDQAFTELVQEAISRQAVETSAATERYLVQLLCRFLRTNSEQLDWALGLELIQSAQLSPAQRRQRLKDIADTSLFLSGVFLEHAEAALPSTEYFFAVGSRAYLNLGQLSPPAAAREPASPATYQELGQRFEDFVCVLSTVSDRELFSDNRRLLDVYSRWLEHGSTRDARRLIAAGFIPSRGSGGNRTH